MNRESRAWAAVGIAVAGFAAAVAGGRSRTSGPAAPPTAMAEGSPTAGALDVAGDGIARAATLRRPPRGARDGSASSDATEAAGRLRPTGTATRSVVEGVPSEAVPDETRFVDPRDVAAREIERRIRELAGTSPSEAAYQLRAGWRALDAARQGRARDRLLALDDARRRLSRGLWLPEALDPGWRATVEAAIAECNDAVYGAGRPLPGVTEEVLVPPGATPWRLIRGRPIGWAPILRWNGIPDLDPRRLRAGSTVRIPLEAAWAVVNTDRGTIDVWIGDAWVREVPAWRNVHAPPPPPGFYLGGNEFLGPEPRRAPDDRWFDRALLRFDGASYERIEILGCDAPPFVAGTATGDRVLVERRDSVELLAWLAYYGDDSRPLVLLVLR